MLKSKDGGAWASAGTLMLAASAVTQTLGMLSAMYFIERTASEKEEELNAMPVDKEVFELDDKIRRRLQKRAKATAWSRAPQIANFGINGLNEKWANESAGF